MYGSLSMHSIDFKHTHAYMHIYIYIFLHILTFGPPLPLYAPPPPPLYLSHLTADSGIKVNDTILPNLPYRNATNAILSAWRGDGEWFNWFWKVAEYNPTTESLIFGRGGFQGGEGSDTGGRWYAVWVK